MKKVFYSWQTDTRRTTGRNLVQRALDDAVASLKAEADVEEAERDDEISLDSDTKGVPGSPPIVETIFKKIDNAAAFVADLTFVSKRLDGRGMPNPNVAIEYGYALKALSHSRIIGVMNAHFGPPTRESLPFDLGHMRHPITYTCADDADEETRSRERKALAAELKAALKAVLDSLPAPVDDRETYTPLQSKGGPARFRGLGEAIGDLHSGSPLPEPQTSVALQDGPSMWLRVMPKFAPLAEVHVTALRAALVNQGQMTYPLNGQHEINSFGIRGADGYGIAANVQQGCTSMLVYAFTSGEVWSIDAALLSFNASVIHLNPPEFKDSLVDYASLLGRLGINGPYRWEAGMEGVRGRRLEVVGRASTFPSQPCLNDRIIVTGDYSGNREEAEAAIEPFIARVHDACHLVRR